VSGAVFVPPIFEYHAVSTLLADANGFASDHDSQATGDS
jgi:hypothetical protein